MVSGHGARLGWGIAGCGWVARDYAMPAIRDSSNGTLLAVHDPSDAALARARDMSVACHTGLDAFLATPGLQAVYVATPNHAHRALTERIAAAGLSVLCEKPMAITLADATRMVSACAEAGVRYATAFDQRFHPAHRHLAQMVAQGAIGHPVAIRIVYACWLDGSWSPDDISTDNWRLDRKRAGGGALFDLAPHGLDLAAMILAEPIVTIAAMGQSRVHGYMESGPAESGHGVEDGALLMARSASGVLLQMHVAYNCPDTLPRRRLEVLGTTRQLVATDTMGQDPGGTLVLTDAADGTAREVAVPDAMRSPFLGQMEAFADAVLSGEAFPFSPAHDVHNMALLERAQAMVNACR
jgi:1,5-anhydro-D-fructose reductase (1,5-anhydro-D-mannitol-forming)